MKEKNWWEKAWAIVLRLLAPPGRGSAGRRGSPRGQGGSVWTRGSGGKKPGSWSSGRHR